MLIERNKYVLVLCHCDANATLVKTLKDCSDQETLETYTELHNELNKNGFTVELHIMDNEASKSLKRQIVKKGTEFQLVELHNHRVNAAERSIITFKNHFISGIASTDPKLPLCL